MSVVDAERLRYGIHTRGVLARDLARLAAIDANTVTRTLRGRPVAMRTLSRITIVLLCRPPLALTYELRVKPQPSHDR
jgi:DNA-binding Xre family transcriptional regulator